MKKNYIFTEKYFCVCLLQFYKDSNIQFAKVFLCNFKILFTQNLIIKKPHGKSKK